MIVLIFIVVLAARVHSGRSSGVRPTCSDKTKRVVYAAIVSRTEMPPKEDVKGLKTWYDVNNFTREFSPTALNPHFQRTVFPKDIRVWPPVKAPPCTGTAAEKPGSPGRGANIAHLDILHNFFLYHGECDALIVFEDDVFSAHPQAPQEAIKQVLKQEEDLNFLGYCYKLKEGHPLESKYPPLCSHAYSVTYTGAKKLYNLIDSCYDTAGALDFQMQELSLAKKISWTVPPHREHDLPGYLNGALYNATKHLSPPHPFDGLFVQGKYDASMNHLKEGAVAHVIYKKGLNYLHAGTWRPIGSMDTFYKLGVKHENVITLSLAQMHQHPIGPPLTDAEVSTIVKSAQSGGV
jgi:hypothetical protein